MEPSKGEVYDQRWPVLCFESVPPTNFSRGAPPERKGWRPPRWAAGFACLLGMMIMNRRSDSARQISEFDAARTPRASGVDPIDWPKEVHLADINAVVAEDRVRHREMEIDVWDRHLQEVVLRQAPYRAPRRG
jgi:hypothetical protein